jgi:type I restriction enzyme M protein
MPACLWFLPLQKAVDKVHSSMPATCYLVTAVERFHGEDIARITSTYHAWHNKTDGYQDVPGFCKSVTLDEIRQKDYLLTPGRYIGLPEDEDDFDFAERFGKLKTELDVQMKEEARLNDLIRENLARLEIKGE